MLNDRGKAILPETLTSGKNRIDFLTPNMPTRRTLEEELREARLALVVARSPNEISLAELRDMFARIRTDLPSLAEETMQTNRDLLRHPRDFYRNLRSEGDARRVEPPPPTPGDDMFRSDSLFILTEILREIARHVAHLLKIS
jgi:hypothetical protein